MKYRIVHRTSYSGHEPVSIGHNQAWLEPRAVDWQTVESFQLQIEPQPSIRSRRLDTFQNPVHLFSFNEGYSRLTVTASTVLNVGPQPSEHAEVISQPWDRLTKDLRRPSQPVDRAALEFLFASPRISWSADMRAYAVEAFEPERPVGEALMDLTRRIHKDFAYDHRATTVSTPVSDVFRLRRGVCQDFAHMQIALLRSCGIPARYVSGYLRTIPPEGQERLIGADASHAWLSAYCGNGQWIDVDPTNDRICSTDHITLAWGRDYGDVPPLTGVFVGGGQHRLTVSVDVQPLPESPAR